MIKVCPTCQQKYPEDTEFCARDGSRLEELQDAGGDPLLGRVLDGRWVIEERIGEGGMGAVYLASQRSVDRKVAIKTLRRELCNSREFVDRFFREARVASTIAHPHCVTILDFGQTDDGILYLAMEYLEGMPLTHRLQHPDLSVREIIQICIQISSALAAAHDNNIIHRDLKPDNVFLLSISDGSTFIKVLDFGIAKVNDSEEKMTKTGQVFGTPEYMSPEQCRGDRLDGRSDLYSLGCILYRMLGGHPPFESDTPMAVLVSHVSEQPRHVREFIERDDIPDELSDLCMRLLAKDVDDRPADAQAVRAELETILANTSPGATGAISTTIAQSDDQVSGETLATEQARVLADGGSAQPSAPNQPPAEPAAPAQAGDEAPQRPQTSDVDTSASLTAAPPQQNRSSLTLILIVGVGAVLAAGCVLGGLYFAYTKLGGDDGSSISISALLGQDDKSADDEPANDNDQAQADDHAKADNHATADDGVAAASGDKTTAALAANGEADAGTPQGAQAGSKPQDGDKSNDAKAQGSKAGDDTTHAAGAGTADDGAKSSDHAKTKSNDDHASTTKIAKVEVHTDKVEIHKDNSDDEPAVGDGRHHDTTKTIATATKVHKQEKPKHDKPKPRGNIRRTRLSTTGAACLKPNVEDVLDGARGRFLSCYSNELSSHPGLSGKVMLAWNISTDGGLIHPSVLVSDMKVVNSCMLHTLKRLRFDAPEGGRCYVRATYHFSP